MFAGVLAALARGRHCLVLTQWTAHVAVLADLLRGAGHVLGKPRFGSVSTALEDEQVDVVLLDVGVSGDEGQPLDPGLCDEHAIKRITVVNREPTCADAMYG